MTFKPANLSNSPTLRALARQALAEGIIKPVEAASIKKEASVPTKSKSLVEKILVLCEGLRNQGLNSYASDIEQRFLLMKKAEKGALNIYNTTGEEGTDVINSAHPKGGNPLDKAWGELGKVETVEEQQQAMVDVCNKQPKGKYASTNKSVINALKVLLAQDAGIETNYDAKIKQIVAEGVAYAAAIVNEIERVDATRRKTEGDGIIMSSVLDDIKEDLGTAQSLATSNIDYANIMKITEAIDDIAPSLVDSSYFRGADGKAFYEKIEGYLNTAKARFNAAFELLKGRVSGAEYQLGLGVAPSKISLDSNSPTATGMPASDLAQKVRADKEQAQNITSQLSNLSSKPAISGNPKRSSFIQQIEKAVFNYASDLDKMLSNLNELGQAELPKNDISKATEGTQLFEGATSYDKFKETATSFHDAINARLKAMSKWV